MRPTDMKDECEVVKRVQARGRQRLHRASLGAHSSLLRNLLCLSCSAERRLRNVLWYVSTKPVHPLPSGDSRVPLPSEPNGRHES